MIHYAFEIVGGPYDGVPGLYWLDDGVGPPPEAIYLGQCQGDGQCIGATTCHNLGGGQPHPAYWDAQEDYRPPAAVSYALEEGLSGYEPGQGRARYVLGGLDLPGERGRALADVGDARRQVAAVEEIRERVTG